MKESKEYQFEVSLSKDAYADKRISGAMIGSTKVEENRIIRKEYGFPSNKGIGYEKVQLTTSELLESLLCGHVFCHLFNTNVLRKDGSFGSSQKCDANFVGSFVIGVDVDKTNYNSASEFVSKLTVKPTFYYTTYSNMQEGKGARFRLIYVFEEKIQNPYFFRYCAYSLNRIIEKDTNELIEDDCNLRCSQYFNGTNKNADNIILDYNNTNLVYSLDDIDVSREGFIDFLNHYCYYKTRNRERTIEINNILNILNNSNISLSSSTTYYSEMENRDTTESETTSEFVSNISVGEIEKGFYKCDENFVSDMSRLDYDEFMRYNRHKYPYIYRIEKNEWIDGIYQYIDEDYFSLYWNATRVQDGQKRRKKLFERMCLRRVMNPEIDANTLLFNAYEDVARFFEVDKDLTIDCLVRNVEVAMNLNIEDIKKNLSETINWLKSRKPKSGIILKSGITFNVAERNTVLKNIRWTLIADVYDNNLSVQENLEFINRNLFKVGKSTIYNFLKENNMNTESSKIQDWSVKELIDVNLSVRKNLELLKNQGIKIGKDRVARILRELKEEEMSNHVISVNDNKVSFSDESLNDNNYKVIIAHIKDIRNNNYNNNLNNSLCNSSLSTTYYNDLESKDTYRITT